MKTVNRNRKAFSIVELLTVMSIIIILMSLLLPAMNMIKRYSKKVKQHAQFHSIAAGLDMFLNEIGDYPESDRLDDDGVPYCGAMRLAEAMVGQDLLGFHERSLFRSNGQDGANIVIYPDFATLTPQEKEDNLASRRGPFVQPDKSEAYTIKEVYPAALLGAVFDPCSMVICDEYPRVRNQQTGKKIGMPVLYYRADVSGQEHVYGGTNNIYENLDNQDLIDLGLPWDSTGASVHPMDTSVASPSGPELFYGITEDSRATALSNLTRPVLADTYILISAGFDGLYGTRDDVYNFGE